MSSQQMYALIDGFERDVRSLIVRYVQPVLEDESEVYGSLYESLVAKRSADGEESGADLVDYLDLRPAYDLLNRHRKHLPAVISAEIKSLTSELDVIVPIRHRVMHSRPLAPGDYDRIISSFNKFDHKYWKHTNRILRFLDEDPSWQPVDSFEPLEDAIRHNLPQSEYDETGLLGRDEEVAQITSALKRKRDSVISLCGEGGIGKTALALEVAYTLLDDPETPFDLVLWSSLKTEKLTGTGVQSLRDSAASMLGAAEQLGKGLERSFSGGLRELGEVLVGFNPLIVIDNLETINGADFVQMYESLPDSVSYLVTSREGIGQLERRIQLEPLRKNDALLLLNQLIKYRKISTLSGISHEARLNIVEKLRYSPLAIRWFILATEAGRNPLDSIRHQDELLFYCVNSVYSNLSNEAVSAFVAMDALKRPVIPDDLVVLLEKTAFEVTSAARELARGSLVRTRISEDSSMVTVLELTETARQYASAMVPRDHPVRLQVLRNEAAFLRDEERRASDAAQRMLAPNAVRLRHDTDAPTAQILRRALSASRSKSYEDAFRLISEAKSLNPEYWEVARVEAFVRASSGDKFGARESYLTAYDTADLAEHRAVVAYFYAGHLARNLKEAELAIPYAKEAHGTLNRPETAATLGSALVWSQQFDAGIDYLERAYDNAEGRTRLISLTALSDAYKRRAEWAATESRNPVQASYDAICAFDLTADEVERGTSDHKVRASACDAANAAVRYIAEAARNGVEIDSMDDFFAKLNQSLGQLSASDRWSYLQGTVRRHSRIAGAPNGLVELSAAMEREVGAIEEEVSNQPGVDNGHIVNLQGGYGFIHSSNHPDNIFFHKSDLTGGLHFADLRVGSRVKFLVVQDDDGRLRGSEVTRT